MDELNSYMQGVRQSIRPIEPRDLACPCALVSATDPDAVKLSREYVLGIIQKIKDQPTTVSFDQECLYNGGAQQCYYNVLAAVQHGGGELATGYIAFAFKPTKNADWQVTSSSATGLDITAHAVWRKPTGELQELTPHYGGGVFVLDDLAQPRAATVIRTFRDTYARAVFQRDSFIGQDEMKFTGQRLYHKSLDLADQVPRHPSVAPKRFKKRR